MKNPQHYNMTDLVFFPIFVQAQKNLKHSFILMTFKIIFLKK